MIKLNLEQLILDNKGTEIEDEIKDSKGKVKIVKRTLRENLLKLLGVQYDSKVLKDPKQYTWIYHLSNQFNKEDEVVEISDEKQEFLLTLARHNKAIIYQNTPQGTMKVEVEIFMPYEVGQMLVMLGEPVIN